MAVVENIALENKIQLSNIKTNVEYSANDPEDGRYCRA